MHKTAAWPLFLIYTVLVVYASLYPFADWRDQGIAAWSFLFTSVSPYWTGFDVWTNVVGYIPFGGLLALSLLRSSRMPHAILIPTLCAALLSLLMESTQSYLPVRVPSKVDWLLNIFGAWIGAFGTMALEKWGAIDRWSQVRARWFVSDARGGIVLLALWPIALLFPASVPFGLGQIMERLETEMLERFEGSEVLNWFALEPLSRQALSPGAELVCVFLGLLIPCLLGFCIIRTVPRKVLFVAGTLSMGFVVTGLSSALSWGPLHAWAWLDFPARWGMAGALVVALLMTALPRRASASLLLLALGLYLSLLNQAPESPYFAQTLQEWEQGRFIRFNGLAQWLGWLWPYAAMVYVLFLFWKRDTKN
jgi:VanZ family protein